MTIRKTQIVASLSCVVMFSCCTICAKDEIAVHNGISCEDDIDVLCGKIRSGKYIDIFMAGYAFDKTIKKLSGEDLNRRLHDFEKELFDIQVTGMRSWQKVSFVIDSVWNTAFAYWNKTPGMTDKERWVIKFKALAWEYRQLNWLKKVAPEDTRPLPLKRNKASVSVRTEYWYWRHTVFGVESAFYKRHIAKSLYEAEDDRYSDEFRAWCFKEIEKIIGRQLTDDDIMFKNEVLRRRAMRLVDRIPNAWNESVVSFTNIACQASSAINRIEGQRNRLMCVEAYSKKIEECLSNLDNSDSKSSLKENSLKLSPEQKGALLKIIVEITGEPPKWYQKELDEKKANVKDVNGKM